MINGKQNIKDWFESQKRPNWRIKKTPNGDIEYFGPTEAETTAEGLQELEKAFTFLSPGQYYIECWNTSDRKNWAKATIIIDGTSGTTTTGNTINGIYGADDIAGIEEKAVEKYKREVEYAEMKQRLADMEERQNSIGFNILKNIEPHAPIIGQIIGQFLKDIPGLSGIDKKKVITVNESEPMENQDFKEVQERAAAAFSDWHEIDPKAVELMESIVKLAKNNNPMYEQAKTMLTSM